MMAWAVFGEIPGRASRVSWGALLMLTGVVMSCFL